MFNNNKKQHEKKEKKFSLYIDLIHLTFKLGLL